MLDMEVKIQVTVSDKNRALHSSKGKQTVTGQNLLVTLAGQPSRPGLGLPARKMTLCPWPNTDHFISPVSERHFEHIQLIWAAQILGFNYFQFCKLFLYFNESSPRDMSRGRKALLWRSRYLDLSTTLTLFSQMCKGEALEEEFEFVWA